MAVGAGLGEVQWLVVRQAVGLALRAAAVGLVATFILTRALAGLLYGVAPDDPLTFATCSALLVAAAFAASYGHARRAIRVDPVVALRVE